MIMNQRALDNPASNIKIKPHQKVQILFLMASKHVFLFAVLNWQTTDLDKAYQDLSMSINIVYINLRNEGKNLMETENINTWKGLQVSCVNTSSIRAESQKIAIFL